MLADLTHETAHTDLLADLLVSEVEYKGIRSISLRESILFG